MDGDFCMNNPFDWSTNNHISYQESENQRRIKELEELCKHLEHRLNTREEREEKDLSNEWMFFMPYYLLIWKFCTLIDIGQTIFMDKSIFWLDISINYSLLFLSQESWEEPAESGNTGPSLVDNQSRDQNNESWLVVREPRRIVIHANYKCLIIMAETI